MSCGACKDTGPGQSGWLAADSGGRFPQPSEREGHLRADLDSARQQSYNMVKEAAREKAEADRLRAVNAKLLEALAIERALRKVKPSSAENEAVCSRCGMLCLIRHKARTIELPEGYVYFHDAHEEDCWEQEKKAREAIEEARK